MVDELQDYQQTTYLTIFSAGKRNIGNLITMPVGYFDFSNGGNVWSAYLFKDNTCKDDRYGSGREGNKSTICCDEGLEGSITAVCTASGKWKLEEDTCIVTTIKELLVFSEVSTFIYTPSTIESQINITCYSYLQRQKIDSWAFYMSVQGNLLSTFCAFSS